MTTLREEVETCVLCSTATEFPVIITTSSFGPPDLDTRPGSPHRQSIAYWLRRCPACGYCAPRISSATNHARAQVASRRYQSQLSDSSYPYLANSFLCWSSLQEAAKEHGAAAWSAIHAAWACDDKRDDDAARQSRLRAIPLLRTARKRRDVFARQPGAEEALMADVLRRAREYPEVRQICEEGLAMEIDELIHKILSYQIMLADKQDDRCYSIEDAQTAAQE